MFKIIYILDYLVSMMHSLGIETVVKDVSYIIFEVWCQYDYRRIFSLFLHIYYMHDKKGATLTL